MIHTVYIDDSTQVGKVILQELQKEKTAVRFQSPINTTEIPQGYMSSSEFRNSVKLGLRNKLKSNSYL